MFLSDIKVPQRHIVWSIPKILRRHNGDIGSNFPILIYFGAKSPLDNQIGIGYLALYWQRPAGGIFAFLEAQYVVAYPHAAHKPTLWQF